MVSRLLLLLLAVVLAAGQAVAQDGQDPPELRDYFQLIRESGMTEVAQGMLKSIAGLRIGASEVFFMRDSLGLYTMGFRSLSCPNPNATPAEIEAARQEREAKMNPDLANLRWLADADSSGFVTTAEAAAFRRLVEFGYKAAHVLNEDGRDMPALCRAFNYKEEDIRRFLADYARLQEKAKRGKIAPFPDVAIR